MRLPADISVEFRVVNGEPVVILNIEESVFELHPEDARLIGEALRAAVSQAEIALAGGGG